MKRRDALKTLLLAFGGTEALQKAGVTQEEFDKWLKEHEGGEIKWSTPDGLRPKVWPQPPQNLQDWIIYAIQCAGPPDQAELRWLTSKEVCELRIRWNKSTLVEHDPQFKGWMFWNKQPRDWVMLDYKIPTEIKAQ